MENIAFNKFVKLLTSQPYFVWNNNIKNDHLKEENLKFEITSFKNIADISIQEIHHKSYNIIEKQFNEKVISKLPNIYFIKSKNIEKKIIETEAAMQNNDIEHIIDPVFGFNYKNFKILAQPKMFSKKTQTISFLKISTSTKLKDILRFLFDYLVLKKQKINIKDVHLYILKTKADYKKGEADFYKTKYINTVKSGRNSSEKYDYINQQLIKAGQGTNQKNLSLEKYSIFEILKKKIITKKRNSFRFKRLPFYLDKIIQAKETKKIGFPTAKDASIFADNPNWNLIMENIDNQWLGFSGNLVKRNDIITKTPKNILINNSRVIDAILNQKHPLIKNKHKILSLLSDLEQKIIWYDFESMSLPICHLNGILPFQQVVFQVSLIKTIKLKELTTNNIVIDPQTINFHAFTKIINAIYHQGFKYVVFNQGYENTRLNEMLHILEQENHPDIQDLSAKVLAITENTIDLQDYFICNSKNRMPEIFIPFLKGKYSIKLIEKYISKYRPYLLNECQMEEYKNLDIQNGMMAMEKANYRALGILGNKQWNKLQKSLKQYCENDVRSMIVIYYLIKDIMKKKL